MGKMKINILGAHNTETQRTRHTCLLIDDVLAIDAGALTSHLSLKGLKKLKAVFLTHSHYDHIRDIPALAINLYLNRRSIDIYTHHAVWKNLTAHLLNGVLYPEYHKKPLDNPTLRYHRLVNLKSALIEGYKILPVKVNHAILTLGFQITSPEGKTIFYTGDTGDGLAETWKSISPDILFIEVTASNYWQEKIKNNGHMTPALLQKELSRFYQLKGYFPHIFAVHLNPGSEKEIKSELEQVSANLGIHILIAKKGMQIQL
jgi:ribonuclease BN (tRNA processing enzyme)